MTERLHAPIGNSGLSPYRTLSLLIVASEKGITAEPDLVKEDTEGLRRFLEGEVLPWFETRKRNWANRP